MLAVATFASTRSANHSARIAERALDLNLRPVLIPAHEWEPTERITFHDEIVRAPRRVRGSRGARRQPLLRRAAPQRRRRDRRADVVEGQGRPAHAAARSRTLAEPPDPDTLRRAAAEPVRAGRRRRVLAGCDPRRRHRSGRRRRAPARDRSAGDRLTLFLRYADQDGGHDTITRYSIIPDENGDWLIGIAPALVAIETQRDPTAGAATRARLRPAPVGRREGSAARADPANGRARRSSRRARRPPAPRESGSRSSRPARREHRLGRTATLRARPRAASPPPRTTARPCTLLVQSTNTTRPSSTSNTLSLRTSP